MGLVDKFARVIHRAFLIPKEYFWYSIVVANGLGFIDKFVGALVDLFGWAQLVCLLRSREIVRHTLRPIVGRV